MHIRRKMIFVIHSILPREISVFVEDYADASLDIFMSSSVTFWLR